MRRSRSLSNIPMPCNARRDSKPKRTRSTIRNSRDQSLDGQTPSVHRYGSDTPLARRLASDFSDQKYKTQKNATPSYSGYKRLGSANSFGSRVSLTKNRSPLEKQSMQKFINDKKWVADQYYKVQTFITTSGLFNPDLSGMIRPPTINIVVQLMSVLLDKLIKTDPLNTQNYADIVLRTLKLLNYPGTITVCTLKSANTMHGWPHFIAILSWLIERLDLASRNKIFREQQDEEIQQMFSLQGSVFEFLTTQYSIYTGCKKTVDQELSIQTEEKLFRDMSLLTGTDHEALQSLEQPLELCRSEITELNKQIEELDQDLSTLQTQNLEKQETIKKFKESTSTKEEDLDNDLAHLRKLREKAAEEKKNLTFSVKQLENTVSSQSCRYNEKTKILSQIEDLKRTIRRKEQKLAEYRIVRDELDHELKTMITEIEAKVDAWNVSITKTMLPEIQNLRLREKGFFSSGFFDELKVVIEEKEKVQKKLLDEYKTTKLHLESLQQDSESLIKNNKALKAKNEDLDNLKNSIQRNREENRNLLSQIDGAKKNIDKYMEKEHLEDNKRKETEKEITEVQERIQKLNEEIDKSAKKGLSIIVEAHNMVIQNLQRIDDVMYSMLNDVTDQAEESKRKMEEMYNYLLTVQEMSGKHFEGFQ